MAEFEIPPNSDPKSWEIGTSKLASETQALIIHNMKIANKQAANEVNLERLNTYANAKQIMPMIHHGKKSCAIRDEIITLAIKKTIFILLDLG
jgi:hypothetical protein